MIANQERDDQHHNNRCQEPQWVLDRYRKGTAQHNGVAILTLLMGSWSDCTTIVTHLGRTCTRSSEDSSQS